MAIHPDFPGLEVFVIADKKAVKEFDVPENDEEVIPPSHSVKYIEATPGENFMIGVRVKPHMKYIHHDLRFDHEVDGIISTSHMSLKQVHSRGGCFVLDSVKFAQGDQIVQRQFAFSTLDTSKELKTKLSSKLILSRRPAGIFV